MPLPESIKVAKGKRLTSFLRVGDSGSCQIPGPRESKEGSQKHSGGYCQKKVEYILGR